MIFQSCTDEFGLDDYGIQIPIVDDRAQKCLALLVDQFGPSIFVKAEESAFIREDVLLAHDEKFVAELFSDNPSRCVEVCYELIDDKGEYHRYDPSKAKFDLTHLAKSMLIHAHGTYQASKRALVDGFCYYLGGGMHHAMSFGGRGFCLVNDIVITAEKLRDEGLVKNVWVIDVDAHKGDGTAQLGTSREWLKTLSLHMEKGWPMDLPEKGESPWLIPSDVDIPFPKGKEDHYLEMLEEGIVQMTDNYPKPDLVMIINGADPYEKDVLPSTSSIRLSKEQLLKRDMYLYEKFSQMNVSQVYTMAGGYGPHSYEIYHNFLQTLLSQSNS